MFFFVTETANAETNVYCAGETNTLVFEAPTLADMEAYYASETLVAYNETHSISVEIAPLSDDEVESVCIANECIPMNIDSI